MVVEDKLAAKASIPVMAVGCTAVERLVTAEWGMAAEGLATAEWGMAVEGLATAEVTMAADRPVATERENVVDVAKAAKGSVAVEKVEILARGNVAVEDAAGSARAKVGGTMAGVSRLMKGSKNHNHCMHEM